MSASSSPTGNKELGKLITAVVICLLVVVVSVASARPHRDNEKAAAKDKVESVKDNADSSKKDEDTKSKSDGEKSKDDGKATSTTKPKDDSSSEGSGTGTPDDPYVGTAGNTDPVVNDSAVTWTGLGNTISQSYGHDRYWPDLQARNGIKKSEADQAQGREKKGKSLGVALASNTTISDADARQTLADQGVPNTENMPVLRVNGFWNTKGLPGHHMERFWDPKSQVRLLLLTPHDYDGFVKGEIPTELLKGVLGMCGNGVDFGPPPVKEAPPATTVPETHTTQPPHTTVPPTAPPTTAPPTTVPPPTTTIQPTTTTTAPCPPGTYRKDGWCQPVPTSED